MPAAMKQNGVHWLPFLPNFSINLVFVLHEKYLLQRFVLSPFEEKTNIILDKSFILANFIETNNIFQELSVLDTVSRTSTQLLNCKEMQVVSCEQTILRSTTSPWCLFYVNPLTAERSRLAWKCLLDPGPEA